jgi:hypothetical protein
MLGIDDFLTKKALSYAIRRGLFYVGTYLVANGWTSDDIWTQLAPGLALLLVDAILSLRDKLKARQVAKAALVTSPPAVGVDLNAAVKAIAKAPKHFLALADAKAEA